MLNFIFNLTNKPWHQKLFVYGLYLSYLLFALSLTGVFPVSYEYLVNLRSLLTYYVCFILILRFNPFIERKIITKNDYKFDRRIAFTAGCFLLLTTTLSNVSLNYLHKKYEKYKFETDGNDGNDGNE
tara:strand:+ start:2221 stop:2601 length:381 start_codon:yes stop_codon:yes gene_type:complete